MKDMAKRALALIAALTLALPCLALPAAAEKDDGTVEEQTQPLTVVAKRITNDDTYFEISLEVNEDYDKYSSVGVVLRYDPTYITPADSWAEDAPAADMSENTSWATRRALPTLGVDTWTTHTALAYEETAPQYGADKPYGYLYLGAEHPRPEEGPNPDATVEPEPGLEPKLGEPTTDPEAAPKPETGTAPVVAARFVYNAKGEKTGEDVRKDLENAWLKGTNTTESIVKDHPTNWDYDWYANDILTIAKDEVAQESPAQYPFVIYTQNYEEKAFMHKFPETVMTSAELRSVDEYKHVVGSNITTENKLNATDISIITLVGDSALKTGGLSLSDIYTILFFDWDDSLLGTLTAGVGEDPTEAVHNYTKEKFIHPDLRELDYLSMSEADKKKRANNYRGEYPEDAPNGSNPLAKSGAYGDEAEEPGSKYPLTNKLDYAFAGKNLADEDHPYTFAYGWTQVLPEAPDYSDKDKYPGKTADILPKAMEDTFTAEAPSENQTYGWAPELDETTGELKNPEDTIPTWIACDFSKITKEDIDASGGNLYVKAVYTACEWLSRDNGSSYADNYTAFGPAKVEVLTSTATNSTYGISFSYERINSYGHGVYRITDPRVTMSMTQIGAAASTPIELKLDNEDVMPVRLTPSNAVQSVGYQLLDEDAILGGKRSLENGIDGKPFQLSGGDGIIYQFNLQSLFELAMEHVQKVIDTGVPYTDSSNNLEYNNQWTDSATWSGLKIYKKESATKTTAISGSTNLRLAQCAIVELMVKQHELGREYSDLTWFQMQYFVLKKTAKTTKIDYIESADAEAYLRENNPLIIKEYESL